MTFLQLNDGIFCEGFYCIYRNNELAQKRRPLPRGPQFITQAKGYMDWMIDQSKIQVVTDYRTRNGNG
jgi:hypothetical protein